jgi:hypothetical protein
MKAMQQVELPGYLVGKRLERIVGINVLTREYNRYRRSVNLDPVKPQTVKRYNDGYPGGTPSEYRNFLMHHIVIS